MTNYLTLQKSGSFELIIKKSRFICQATRITSEEEAQAFIQQVHKAHPKANHHCFAYQIGLNFELQKQSDDGEPSGTAGIPILEVLHKMHLTNLCVVVTRYFGGIKLGTGGLIRAYSHATSAGIEVFGVVQGVQQTACRLIIAYPQYDVLQHFLQQKTLSAVDLQYGTDIQLTLWLNNEEVTDYQKALTDLLNGQLQFEIGEQAYHEVPITVQKIHDLFY